MLPIRILHVGAGVRGRHWLEQVAGSSVAVSVGCVEPDAASLAAARPHLTRDVPTFASLDEALGAVDAEAALIGSPSSLHAEQAVRALEAGLAVLVEKPFAPSAAEARRVLAVAERVGRPVMVAEQFRFVPAERTVRKLVAAGALGTISNVAFADRRRMPPDMHGPWVADLAYPQLRELAVHHFDSLLGFFDRNPRSVAARAWNPAESGYASGACTEALVELEGGIHVQYLGTLSSNKFGYLLRIEGDRGDLWTNRKLVLVRPRGKRLFLPVRLAQVPKGDERPYPYEGMTALLEGLHAAVRDGVEPETSGERNVWAVALVEAAIRSDREGRTVELSEVHPAADDPGAAG